MLLPLLHRGWVRNRDLIFSIQWPSGKLIDGKLGPLGVSVSNSEVPQARGSKLNIPPCLPPLSCVISPESPPSGVLSGFWWIFLSIEQSTLKMALQSTILSRKHGSLENLCQVKIFWNHFRDPIILEGCYELRNRHIRETWNTSFPKTTFDQHFLFLLVTNLSGVPFSSHSLFIHSIWGSHQNGLD